MARVDLRYDRIDFENPTLVEGLPGTGLVGKIAADHLVEELDMTYYAAVHCEGFPPVAVYRGKDSTLRPPVRVYADESADLLVLQSDVPVSPSAAPDFATCLTDWLAEHGVLPIYLSGLGGQKEGMPGVYGVYTGDGKALLDDAGIVPPAENGLVSGPTGALMYRAETTQLAAVGLVVECETQFPDPEAARVLVDDGITPLTGIDVDTEMFTEQEAEIRAARDRLAQQLREADDERTEARPLRMFQ